MQYFFTPGNALLELLSCGCFVSDHAFMHPERKLDHFVLLFGLTGELHMACGDREYCITPQTALLLPANCDHRGIRFTTEPISYYWCHFSCHESFFLLDPQTAESGFLLGKSACPSGISLPVFAAATNPERIILIFQQLMHIAYMKYSVPHAADYSLMSLIVELAEQSTHVDPAESRNQANLSEIKEWIRINLREPLTAQMVADKFRYSPDYLSSLFRRHTGSSILHYIRNQRIGYAKELLLCTNLHVQEIAGLCGYSDEKYFMRQFKAVENVSPTQFRHAYTERHLNNR